MPARRYMSMSEDIGTVPRVVGRIAGGWAYEMELQRQHGSWVVTHLRVFPDPGDLDAERLLQCQRCSPQGKAVVHAFEEKRLVVREPNKARLRRALSVFSITALVQRVITSILRRRKSA